MIKIFDGNNVFWCSITIRISPYPPSFNRIAARIIDPAIGASTCAFGSHRWVMYIGSFTRNPRIRISHGREVIHWEFDIGINKLFVRLFVYRDIIIRSIGSDEEIVYIIKYMLACTRSG